MLQALRQHRTSARLAKGLVALLFVQLLIPLQAHSQYRRDSNGITVVICTLQGARNIQLDPSAGATSHHPHASAAMLFSNLLNNLSPVVAVVQPPMQVLSWSTTLASTAVAVPAHGQPTRPVAARPWPESKPFFRTRAVSRPGSSFCMPVSLEDYP